MKVTRSLYSSDVVWLSWRDCIALIFGRVLRLGGVEVQRKGRA